MTTAILTPFDFSDTVKAGRRRFWKQILPVTSIDYDGQKVDFDREFHNDLELSFRDGAYDQVPLVFADSGNRHNEDPRNFAGELLAVENRGDNGTWGLIEADHAGARAIKKNPRLGVSARIMQNVQKADGRTFKRAIRHVLLTMNPRVSGMEPWQAVDLSDEDADIEVVDLTAEIYKEESDMGKPIKRTADGKIDLSALSDDEFQRLLDLAAEEDFDEEDEDEEDEEVDPDEVENPTTTPPAVKKKKSKKKITIEKESEGDDDEEEDDESTDLSDAVKARRSSDLAAVRTMQLDLAEERWERSRSEYSKSGVPPFLLDLAAPVLKQPEAVTIDLSDNETVDASATIRKMLDGVKGLIDLGEEVGHMVDLSDVGDKEDPDTAFLAAWDKQYG